MRGFFKSFLLFCTLFLTSPTWADATSGQACDATTKCVANLYCDSETKKCLSCQDATGNKYPYSDAGSTSIGSCYTSCSDSEIKENGHKLGTKQALEPKKAYYNNNCKYNITCEPIAVKSGDTCTGRCFKITLSKNLTNIWEDPKYLYEKYANGFYTDKNCAGTKLDPNTTAEPNHEGGWIIPTYTWWQDFIGYYTQQTDGEIRFGSTGKPSSGTTYTTFSTNTTLYGHWNIYSYTIEYDIDGTSYTTQTCYFPRNGVTAPDNDSDAKCLAKNPPNQSKIINNKAYTITKWSTGKNGTGTIYEPETHIQHTSDTIKLYAVWESCSPGYYCGTSGKKPCPAGATSDEGSNSETQCYISSATKFKDTAEGSIEFTLPINTDTKIYYSK